MRKYIVTILLFIIPTIVFAQEEPTTNNKVDIYYFYSNNCQYSAKMTPLLEDLAIKNGNINLRKFEVSENETNADLYRIMAGAYGNITLDEVPLIYIGGWYVQGYDPEKAAVYIDYCLAANCVSPLDRLKQYQEYVKNNPEVVSKERDWVNIIVGWTVIVLILLLFLWLFIRLFSKIFNGIKNANKKG